MPQCAAYKPAMLQAYKQNSFILVETLDDLMKVRDALAGHRIVSVDLENNHRDSYNGFTCLIQLSVWEEATGEVKSYIVDVLAPEVGPNLR